MPLSDREKNVFLDAYARGFYEGSIGLYKEAEIKIALDYMLEQLRKRYQLSKEMRDEMKQELHDFWKDVDVSSKYIRDITEDDIRKRMG